MNLTAKAKSINDFWVHTEGQYAKATFNGSMEADYAKCLKSLLRSMRGRGFQYLFVIKGAVFFKKEKAI